MLKDKEGFFLVTVRKEEDGDRMDVLLSRRFSCSRTSLRNKLKSVVLGENGSVLKWSRRLRSGQVVRIRAIRRPEPDVPVTYRIIYMDKWIVVVDKGTGAPVHPSRSYRTKTILTALRAELGDMELSPAHRLDRETSGVLVFSRTSGIAAKLQTQFATHSIQKTYLAIVKGIPSPPEQLLAQPLERDPEFPIDCKMRLAIDGASAGKPAQTLIKVLDDCGDKALVEARPRTGRMHQIRLHLAENSHPILGDKLYQFGGEAYLAMIGDELDASWYERLGHHRLALHASRLVITHPETAQRMEFKAELPADMLQLLGKEMSSRHIG